MNRDLKPENLLLKKKYSCQEVSCTMENLRCVDFGSAAQLEPGWYPSHPLLLLLLGKDLHFHMQRTWLCQLVLSVLHRANWCLS